MEKIEIINRGFEFLKNNYSDVLLAGFVSKDELLNEMTKWASREEFDGEYFDHEYNDMDSVGSDDGYSYGYIYLPLCGDIYMKFDIRS